MIPHDEGFSSDQLAVALREKLASIPPTTERLIARYSEEPASLGGLAGPIHRHAWNFLLHWTERSDDGLSIPRRGPDGRIVA